MKLYRFSFPADKFAALSSKDQLFFVRLAQATNDLRHIQNLMMAGSTAVSVHKGIDQKLALHQLLFSVRLVYSGVFEAWVIIKKDWCKKRGIGSNYTARLKPKASAALAALENYFGVKNLVEQVRNKFASHYDANVIAAALAKIASREGQSLVISEGGRNLFFLSAEEIRNVSVLGVVDPTLFQPGGLTADKINASVRKLYDEALYVLNLLTVFSEGALLLITAKCGLAQRDLVSSSAISDPEAAQSVIFIDEDRPPRGR